ncbi:MAG: TatD family hydrolase [Porticoccaceae bacterium]
MDTTLVDIGVNLASERFDKDRDEVLARARDAGIGHCVITGTSAQGSHDAVMLCERYGEQFPGMLSCTVGVHPHEAGNHTPETSRQLRALAIEHPQWVKAIGETGLDFNRNFSTPVAQEKAFEAQLELASELGLPLFLHERDAAERQYQILRSWRDNIRNAVIHCFTGGRTSLYRYLDLDLYIGITGWICDERRGLELQSLVAEIPLQRLMIETDAPYLTPRTLTAKPKTGRNEPAFLVEVLQGVAAHRPESEAEIALATRNNSFEFFGL